jgi:hypothetical protein
MGISMIVSAKAGAIVDACSESRDAIPSKEG